MTERLVLERTSPKCRKRFGVSVQSEVIVLREECRLPFRVIQRYLKWRYGLRLSVGKLVGLARGAPEPGSGRGGVGR